MPEIDYIKLVSSTHIFYMRGNVFKMFVQDRLSGQKNLNHTMMNSDYAIEKATNKLVKCRSYVDEAFDGRLARPLFIVQLSE